jgi:hypothetical protein
VCGCKHKQKSILPKVRSKAYPTPPTKWKKKKISLDLRGEISFPEVKKEAVKRERESKKN